MTNDNCALKFVQFLHPGREYVLTNDEISAGEKEWNYGAHFRKFIKTKGRYMKDGQEVDADELLFWGEWEPESIVEKRCSNTGWIHKPILRLSPNGDFNAQPTKLLRGKIENRRNTDPFVFGDDGFLYTLCRQVNKKGHRTKMSYLAKGSIIVFGSNVNQRQNFAVDTVFVVQDYKDYDAGTDETPLDGFAPPLYKELMGMHIGECCGELRCYKGATPHNPINGMYSFTPCKLSKSTKENTFFERPILTASDMQSLHLSVQPSKPLIADRMNTNFKSTANLTIDDMKNIWDRLCEILLKEDFLAGTHFEYELIK